MAEATALLVEHPRAGVLRLTINDPARHNPLSSALFRAMGEAIERGVSGGARAVVLTGAGETVFAAGADLSELTAETEGLGGDFGEAMEAAQAAIEASDAVVVARIQGHCLGAGYQLALACDLRVATDDARLGVPASRFGLLPGWVHHRRMLQQLGPRVTRELMLTARSFTGAEALRRGLADYICPRAELDRVVESLLDDVLGGAPLTVRNSKRITNTLLRNDAAGTELDPAGLAELERLALECHGSEDVAEGLRAFFEHREPRFAGR